MDAARAPIWYSSQGMRSDKGCERVHEMHWIGFCAHTAHGNKYARTRVNLSGCDYGKILRRPRCGWVWSVTKSIASVASEFASMKSKFAQLPFKFSAIDSLFDAMISFPTWLNLRWYQRTWQTKAAVQNSNAENLSCISLQQKIHSFYWAADSGIHCQKNAVWWLQSFLLICFFF